MVMLLFVYYDKGNYGYFIESFTSQHLDCYGPIWELWKMWNTQWLEYFKIEYSVYFINDVVLWKSAI